MINILSRALCFVAIIAVGFLLRRSGFFKREDFTLLSRIVINITLPAAIINNLNGRELEPSLLVLVLVGFLYGVVLMIVGYMLNRRRGPDAQAFAMVNSSGVNISNFVLPFAQGFLGPEGVMATSLFDVGNGVICLGGSFGVAGAVLDKEKGFSFRPILRSVLKSVPLMTYVAMCLLAVLRIRLPEPVTTLAGIVGGANAFLAMLMLGIGFRGVMLFPAACPGRLPRGGDHSVPRAYRQRRAGFYRPAEGRLRTGQRHQFLLYPDQHGADHRRADVDRHVTGLFNAGSARQPRTFSG